MKKQNPISNRGVAPFYADWPVQVLAVRSDGGESVARLPVALNKLLPTVTSAQSVSLDLSALTPGEVKLFVGVPNPLQTGKPLRFANTDAEPLRPGWLTLGKIIVP